MNAEKRMLHNARMIAVTALLFLIMLGSCAVADAASVWDGTIPTTQPAGFVIDYDNRAIRIYDAASFAYLHNYDMEVDYQQAISDGKGTYNNFYYAWGWTVYLETDIDLNNHPWTPIVFGVGSNSRKDRRGFDGQGHTVSNLNVNASSDGAGLFGNVRDLSNLTVENAKVTSTSSSVGAVSGGCTGTVKNVHVVNAQVTGAKYVGGIVGYAYASFIDCSVENSTVTNTGHKDAGGIVGFLCDPQTVTGNTVTNTTIKNTSSNSEQNVGAIVGRWNDPQREIDGVVKKGVLENNKTDASLPLVDAAVNGTKPVQKADPYLSSPGSLPKTGDNSQIALWLSLLTLAAAGMLLSMKKHANGRV